jgi:hypothetical protein
VLAVWQEPATAAAIRAYLAARRQG